MLLKPRLLVSPHISTIGFDIYWYWSTWVPSLSILLFSLKYICKGCLIDRELLHLWRLEQDYAISHLLSCWFQHLECSSLSSLRIVLKDVIEGSILYNVWSIVVMSRHTMKPVWVDTWTMLLNGLVSEYSSDSLVFLEFFWLCLDVIGSILLIAVGNCLENVFRGSVMSRVLVWFIWLYSFDRVELFFLLVSWLYLRSVMLLVFLLYHWLYLIMLSNFVISLTNGLLLDIMLSMTNNCDWVIVWCRRISWWIMLLISFGLLIIFFTPTSCWFWFSLLLNMMWFFITLIDK